MSEALRMPGGPRRVFEEYEASMEALGAMIRRQLAPVFRPGDNLDVEIVVRGGKLRLKIASLSKDPSWRDASQ